MSSSANLFRFVTEKQSFRIGITGLQTMIFIALWTRAEKISGKPHLVYERTPSGVITWVKSKEDDYARPKENMTYGFLGKSLVSHRRDS